MSSISKVVIDLEKRIYDRQKYKLSLEPMKVEIKRLMHELSKILETLK